MEDQIKITTSDRIQLSKFCPLIKETCRSDCACFCKAKFEEISVLGICSGQFFEACCFSPLIDGSINIEGNLF